MKKEQSIIDQEKAFIGDIRETFSTPAGQRILKFLKDTYLRSPLNGNNREDIGAHNLALQLVDIAESSDIQISKRLSDVQKYLEQTKSDEEFFKQ